MSAPGRREPVRGLGLALAVAILLCGGALGGEARQVASPRVGPDEDATALFAGLSRDAPLAAGWRLRDAFVDRGAIVARVQRETGPARAVVFGSLRVRHGQARAVHEAFVVDAPAAVGAALEPLVAALGRTAQARGSHDIGADALFEHQAVPGDVSSRWVWLLALVGLLAGAGVAGQTLLGLAGQTVPGLTLGAQRLGPVERGLLGIGGVLLAWGVLSAVVDAGQIRGPLHANAHGAEEIDDLVAPLRSPYPPYLGATQTALTDLGFAAGGLLGVERSVDGLWRLHAGLGGLAALAVGLLALELLTWLVGRPRPAVGGGVALLGGLAVAAHPHLLRVFGSESAFAWEVALLPVMWWGLLRFARRGQPGAFVVAAAAGGLVTGLHALTPLHVAWPAGLALVGASAGRRRGRAWRRDVWLGLLSVALLVWAAPHLQLLLALGDERGPAAILELRMRAVDGLLSPLNLPFLPATGVWPLAWGGLAALCLGALLRRPRLGLLLLVATALLLVKGLLLQTCWTDVVRYQAPSAAWLSVLGAVGAGLLLRAAGQGPLRLATWLVLAAVLGATCHAARPAFAALDDEARAYAWWQDVAAHADLPAGAILMTVGAPRPPPGVAGEAPRAPFVDAGRSVRAVTFDPQRPVAPRERAALVVARDLSLAWLAAAADNPHRRRRRSAAHAAAHLRALHAALPGPWGSLGATTLRPASSPVATVAPAYHSLGGEPVRLELLVPADAAALSAPRAP